jgi:hypothetical protein
LTQSPSGFFITLASAAATAPEPGFPLFIATLLMVGGEGAESTQRNNGGTEAVETMTEWGWMNCSPPR